MDEAGSSPPSLNDFSRQAIQKAIRNEALTHPITLYSGVVAVLAGVSWALFSAPAFLWAAFGATVTAVSGLIVNYCFRDQALGEKYLNRLNQRITQRKQGVIISLQDDLRKCLDIPDAEDHVNRALEQFEKINRSYETLRELLDKSFGAGKIDFGRIWGSSEQAYLGVLDNLRQVVTMLRSLATIDLESIDKRIEQLRSVARMAESDRRELATLEKRRRVREYQLQKVKDLLTRNEEAITGIEEATAAVAGVGTGDTFADMDPETSVGQLRDLAQRIRNSRKESEL